MFDWDESPDLNITPLVDVMLVLMAILMITAPSINYEEKVQLPSGSQADKISKSKGLTIIIDNKGVISFNNSSYQTIDKFSDNFVVSSSKYNKNDFIHLQIDKNLRYETVTNFISVIQKVGFNRISVMTK
jgi:biopolymer transport protein ExbD